MKRRIGIFGGSFDPVHNGHLHVARAALDELGLDEVRFLPSPQPPHKRGRRLLPLDDRIELLRLAIAGEPRFAIDDREARAVSCYTYDTLDALQRELGPDVELFFLIGGDSLRDLPKWHRAAELVRRFTLVTVPREPGEDAAALREPLARAFGADLADKLARSMLRVAPLPCSSTGIRAAGTGSETARAALPPAVLARIRERGHYATGGDPGGRPDPAIGDG